MKAEKFYGEQLQIGNYPTLFGRPRLHIFANGVDGSQVFNDASFEQNVITPVGNVQVDTAQSKFRGSSILFQGSGDYLSIPVSDAFTMGNAFNINAWVRWTSSPTSEQYIYSQAVDSSNFIFFRVDRDSGIFLVHDSGSPIRNQSFVFSILALDTWHLFNLVVTSSQIIFHVNGVIIGNPSDSGSIPSFDAPIRIGSRDGFPAGDFNGWMSNIMVHKSSANSSAHSGAALPQSIYHNQFNTSVVLSPGSKRIQVMGNLTNTNLTLPDARLLRTGGPHFIIVRPGTQSTVTVKDNAGANVDFLSGNEQFTEAVLVDNTTQAGTWLLRIKDISGVG